MEFERHDRSSRWQRRSSVPKLLKRPPRPYPCTKVGSGLNLTSAAHVVHFDRWWNPAVENQATDRAYRIGQKRNVLVQKFVCRGTLEAKIDLLIDSKKT